MKILTDENGKKYEVVYETSGISHDSIKADYLYTVKEIKEEKPWPQIGDEYWYVNAEAELESFVYNSDSIDINLLNFNNIYTTKKDAEMAAIRDRGMRVRNTAKREEEFFVWDFDFEHTQRIEVGGWDAYVTQPKFSTRQEAQAWGDEFAEAFMWFNN